MSNKPERVVILSKMRGAAFEKDFFIEIQEKVLEGYRVATNDRRVDQSLRNFKGNLGRVVMYLDGEQPESSKPAKVEQKESPVLAETAEKANASGALENKPVEKKDEKETPKAKKAPAKKKKPAKKTDSK